ncbi:SH3 domain-containing YSC84-like protein 1 isoform X2 [Haliotis rufescens]|uniref:SH3 domain-containing YSC84-like protein 1 isoform X1 n=1 Tax=Haliotis rufescens TaxID=6454 RepID=UPI00201EBE0D|nr:SH3 domain-containing YSC84-like protein 1 isoform X1 [Haliotis rufescens]XP_048242070.1 SH3 domain-containing YSC84-like protein 1 isoform X2 [Haliotis rufescens]
MVNTPIPHSLKSEAKKAAKILREFTMPSARAGPDKLIPAGILAKAKGLAILTVVKAGFLVTARGGSGVVIAKLEDADEDSHTCGWSAPSAIGIAGLGGGFEIGAEVTDFVIILNKKSAVEAFSKGGNLTLGGNFTIAAGPLGRNIEGDVSLRSPAAMYTYSKTKGIFAGISIEGSGLIERKDANRKFYGQDIRAYRILMGEVDPPAECDALYEVLRTHREVAVRAAMKMAKEQAWKHRHTIKDVVTTGIAHKLSAFRSGEKGDKSESTGDRSSHVSAHDSAHQWARESAQDSAWETASSDKMDKFARTYSSKTVTTKTTHVVRTASTASGKAQLRHSPPSLRHSPPSLSIRSRDKPPKTDAVVKWDNLVAVAEIPFRGQLSCDLSFKTGDRIEILTRTDSQFDWWEGSLQDKVGIFPANFVRVL